jgi:hypothetical protein
MEMTGQLHALAALPSGKKLGGPRSRYGCRAVEKNLDPAGNQIPAIQPITIVAELSWLLKILKTFFIYTGA